MGAFEHWPDHVVRFVCLLVGMAVLALVVGVVGVGGWFALAETWPESAAAIALFASDAWTGIRSAVAEVSGAAGALQSSGGIVLVAAAILVTTIPISVALYFAARWIINYLEARQDAMLAKFCGDVDPLFPRRTFAVAKARAKDRRHAIERFLNSGTRPPLYVETRFGEVFVREHVVRHQEFTEVHPPLLAPEFLEAPRNHPMRVTPGCVEGPEDIAGQFVRLMFEAAPPKGSSLSPEEVILPLLGRVVDAAILADRHFDSLRNEQGWIAMPFYDRIYAEYRPVPWYLQCVLRAAIGNKFPARVVIETRFPEVFKAALFDGRKAKPDVYSNWFGIGIKVQSPQPPKKTGIVKNWSKKIEPVCRRLKSHTSGVVSSKLNVAVTTNPPGTPDEVFHVMPSGPLADGCPSVALPVSLPRRGALVQAPAAWLFRPKAFLDPDCRAYCVRSIPPGEQTISIDTRTFGTPLCSAGAMPSEFTAPGSVHARRTAWVGAFFDHELRIANRFPLAACVTAASVRYDLRGAFAVQKGGGGFGGVFVSLSGPGDATNLLLHEPLFNDYLNHLAQVGLVLMRMPPCEGEAFVPSHAAAYAR